MGAGGLEGKTVPLQSVGVQGAEEGGMGLEGRVALREWQGRLPPRGKGEGGEDTWCGRVVSVARQTEGRKGGYRQRKEHRAGRHGGCKWGRFGEL